MKYAGILARLRKEKGYTQAEVADYVSRHSDRSYTFKMISHWEKGVSSPPVEQFLLLCEFYGVKDIQGTFRGIRTESYNLSKLNELGKNRVEEYIAMLSGTAQFSDSGNEKTLMNRRFIRLYNIPAAAGSGNFLDNDSYDGFEVDGTVPGEASFAVKVSGDSMKPRFVDSQIVFIKELRQLEIGDIGVFELNGDAYIKKLGRGELLSLNPLYKPIKIRDSDSFHIFGKVVG